MTHKAKLSLLAAASAVASFSLFISGCSPECVDKFDCASKAKAGEDYTCTANKCVIGSPGKLDAGLPTGGGSAGGAAGGSAGGAAGGGSAGGAAGGTSEIDAGTDAGMSTDAGMATDAGATDGGAGVQQTPPQGTQAEVQAWIDLGYYKGAGWKCEASAHAGVFGSPHGGNRICNNAALSSTATGVYPVGSASVKELYIAQTDGGIAPDAGIIGFAVNRKVTAGASTPTSWYWFEVVNGGQIVNGTSAVGCTGCHAAAGTDAAHPGRDYVYTQVP
jgi:hypothetical protein